MIYTYLIGPRSVGFGEPHYDQRQHRSAIEDPSGEAEEIDKRIDTAGNHHGYRDEWLQKIKMD